MRAIRTFAMLVVLGTVGPTLAFAQAGSQAAPEPALSVTEPPAAVPPAQPQPDAQPKLVSQPSQPSTSPALNFSQPTVQTDKDESLVEKWWFWTAVGAVAAGTVAVIWISSRGHAPPATDLGNQEFQP